MPAVALILNSWLIFLASVFFYVVYRILTRKESDYLREKFGKEYEDYRKKVLLPFL